MDGEINNFIKVWILAIASLCFCHYIIARIPRGFLRLISLLPIFYLFILLPFNLSSVHLGGPTAFYLVWLGNFKLLLFSFDHGPLSSHPPLSILNFISIALLPINPKQGLHAKITATDPSLNYRRSKLAIKLVILALIIRIYDYKQNLHPNFILALYCCHVYLGVEFALAISAGLVRVGLGFEIEPQFNEPYLATSLQDFWGRRWNLMVTTILRPTVYNPIREMTTRMFGKRLWGPLPAIFATFLVSGIMHEIIYFYLTRVGPTWEVTCFFVIHGVCTATEVVAKKALAGRYRLHRLVSGPLTVGFVAVTGVWLFLPQILRNGVDLKAIEEYSIFVRFLRSKLEYHFYLSN